MGEVEIIKSKMKKLSIMLAICIGMFTSCSERTVAVKPEPVIMEHTAPPFAGAVWIDNEYRWDHGTYLVVPGHWMRTNRGWVPGHWTPARRGFRWQRGHFR